MHRAGHRHRLEPARAIVTKGRQAAAPTGPDQQVFPSIPIQIEPRHARSQPTQLPGQQRLALLVIKRLILMPVGDQRADVLEPRRALLCQGRSGLRNLRGATLVHLVNPVWLHS